MVRGPLVRLPSRGNRSDSRAGRREKEAAWCGHPSDWTHAAPVLVLPLLAVAGPVARVQKNPSEALCGVESQDRARPPSLCLPRDVGLRKDGESAPRDMLPGERIQTARCCVGRETLDSRRPLIPRPGRNEVSMFAACRTFHPAGPPLEPQGGRPRNLLKHCQDGPENTRSPLNLKVWSARPTTCTPKQRRISPLVRIPHSAPACKSQPGTT